VHSNLIKIRCYFVTLKNHFGDALTSNVILYYIMSCNLSFIFDVQSYAWQLDSLTNLAIFIRPSRDHIMWLGMAGVHTGFRTVTLVLYIGSLPNLATWFPCRRGRTLFILGSLGQRSRSLTINIIFDNRAVST
jgi:hypothetical protein